MTATLLLSSALAIVLPLVDAMPDPQDVKPGWIAMGLMILLFVVTVLLWLSMRRQLKKINFDDGVDRSDPATRGAAGERDGQAQPPGE